MAGPKVFAPLLQDIGPGDTTILVPSGLAPNFVDANKLYLHDGTSADGEIAEITGRDEAAGTFTVTREVDGTTARTWYSHATTVHAYIPATAGGGGSPYIADDGGEPGTAPEATGPGSLAMGDGAKTTGAYAYYATALGYNAKAYTPGSIAGGGAYFYAYGYAYNYPGSEVKGGYFSAGCTALGFGHVIDGSFGGTALGYGNKVYGSRSVALGSNCTVNGDDAVALGGDAQADGNDSFAAGNGAAAYGNGGFALGKSTRAHGNNSLALGSYGEAVNSYTEALGAGALTYGQTGQVVRQPMNEYSNGVDTTYDMSPGLPIGQYSGSVAGFKGQIAAISKSGYAAHWEVSGLAHNFDGTGAVLASYTVNKLSYTGTNTDTAYYWSVSLAASGNNVVAQVAGQAGEYVQWMGYLAATNVYGQP